MQKIQPEITNEPSKRTAFSFLIAAFISVGSAVILLFAVFGVWNYFNPSYMPYTLKSPIISSNEVSLYGKGDTYFVSLPIQQIQLIESISPLRTLEVQIALVIESAADKNDIAAALPLLQDTTVSYLRTLRINELQEMGRLFDTKEALLDRFNTLLAPISVQDILFQKMLIREGM